MAANVAIIIPVYKEKLNDFEKISLAQIKKVLGHYPIIFVAPEGKFFPYFQVGTRVEHFPQQFFQSTLTYNILMMSGIFYEAFLEYDYILIYQLDAFVFSDKLEYFCSLGYDNIGAPWPRWWAKKIPYGKNFIIPRVGNGGFCLRNVKACYKLLMEHSNWVENLRDLPEDVFWAYCGMRSDSNFRTAPINIGYKFAAEFNPVRVTKKNGGELPFGCHAFHNFSADFYIKVLLNYGYDLRPFQKLMNKYNDGGLQNWLLNVAIMRLNRRLNLGQPLSQYLQQNRYASIRVIRHPLTMIILARLLLENPNFSDKIYFYDETELDILLSDCQPEKLPHLLLTTGGIDINSIAALEKSGLAYGKRVVSFQREYLNYCEKLFHNLGK